MLGPGCGVNLDGFNHAARTAVLDPPAFDIAATFAKIDAEEAVAAAPCDTFLTGPSAR